VEEPQVTDLLVFGAKFLYGYFYAELSNFTIMMYGAMMFFLFKRWKLDVRLLVVTFAMALFAFALIWGNDPALVATWEQGAVLPYGLLWRLANPLWWTGMYQYVAFGWGAVQVALMWFLGVRRKVFGWGWVLFAQLFDLAMMRSQNPQGIFPMMFVFLAPVWLPLIAGFFLAKLPIGFALNSREWLCTFGHPSTILLVHTPALDYYVPLCDRFSYSIVQYPSLIFGMTLYAISFMAMGYVLWRWWLVRFVTRKNLKRVLALLRRTLVCDCEECRK
jgi:hypothetical protein